MRISAILIGIFSVAVVVSQTSVSNAAIAPGPFGNKSNLLTTPASPLASPAAAPATANPAASAASLPTAKTNSLAFTCADLRRTALKMSAHASNLANRMTSRTAEGGPYKRMEVVCRAAGGAFCDIEKTEGERVQYQPGHPDADINGNVKFPDINLGSESAGLNSAASELKVMASQGACGTKAIEQGLLTVVKYQPDFEVMMDTMTFGTDGRIARWSRTTREGKTQNFSFKEDGTPVGL